jgi:hypothetical protein
MHWAQQSAQSTGTVPVVPTDPLQLLATAALQQQQATRQLRGGSQFQRQRQQGVDAAAGLA